jgi:hypothetical protein
LDLGYRASDLLQANAIIWVEGPSDRLYIRHWLDKVDHELIEGVHYSLMFYGGRRLAHLSVNDVEVQDFISLRRINQWLSIVIDSDRASSNGTINRTKKRVRDEFNRPPGHAWITQGREIENYIPDDVLWRAILKTDSKAKRLADPEDRYADVMTVDVNGKPKSVDKVKVAHHVVAEEANLSRLDLRKRVRELASFVREANGMEPLA